MSGFFPLAEYVFKASTSFDWIGLEPEMKWMFPQITYEEKAKKKKKNRRHLSWVKPEI